MARDLERLITLAREYIGADERRLPNTIVQEVTNSVIDMVASVPITWNEKTVSYTTNDVSIWSGDITDERYVDGEDFFLDTIPLEYGAYDTFDLPSDMKEPIALYRLDDSKNRIFLTNLSRDEAFNYYSATDNDTSRTEAGTPTHWTISGDRIVVFPFPDSNSYTLYFWYYARPTEVTSQKQVHPMIVRYWPLILYGVLLESARYLNEDALIPLYSERFNTLLRKFQIEEARKHHVNRAVYSRISGQAGGGIE